MGGPQGWYRDPWRRHEARYFSDGQPTFLVRDGDSEGRDPVPDGPIPLMDLTPATLHFDENETPRWSGNEARTLDSTEGITIPGGLVIVDPYRNQSPARFWGRALLGGIGGPYGVLGIRRDIVILDPTKRHELYRSGPYDAISVNTGLRRILAEIKDLGLDEFLRTRHSDSTPLAGTTGFRGPGGLRQAAVLSVELYWYAIRHPFSRRRPR